MNTVLCWFSLFLAFVLGPGAVGQVSSPAAPTAVATMEAFELVDPWVRGLSVPADASGPEVAGACVTLRHRGRLVGRGVAIGLGPSTVPDAARLAISEAKAALVTVNDAAARDRALLEAPSLIVSVELAGAPLPIDEPSYTLISAAISPGTEAVAVRFGTAAGAVFPLELLSTGQQAGGAVSRLVSELTGDAFAGTRQPIDLVNDAGAGLFRLRTTAVTQVQPGGRPVPLYRGGRLVELADVASVESIRNFAVELLSFLDRSDDLGTYLPTNDSAVGQASEATRALRAFAIVRASRELGRSASVDADRLREIVAEVPCEDAASCALRALAESELGLNSGTDWHGEFRAAGDVERAIVAYSLAKHGEVDAATEIVRELRRVDNAAHLVGMMPWLGWAEHEIAGADGISSAVGLRQMRDIVTDFQLTAADAGVENLDLVGGVVFTSGTVPLPTWQTARPMAYLASMLDDPRVTEPSEVERELASLLNAIRFLRQLSASETESFLYRDPARAIGGVRAATWDSSMPTDASAMTLLVLLETLESLDSLAERETGETGAD